LPTSLPGKMADRLLQRSSFCSSPKRPDLPSALGVLLLSHDWEEAEMTPEVRRMLMGACIVAIAGLWYFSMKEKPAAGTGANTPGTSAPAGSTKP